MRNMMILALLGLTACVEEPVVDGRTAFLTDCAGCHGDAGKGDGPFAHTLATRPADLTQLAANNGGVFPRDEVMSIIDGLDRSTHFSIDMPEFGAGDMGEVIIVEEGGLGTPVPTRLLALADYLESIQE